MLVFGRKSRQAVVVSRNNGSLKPLLTITVLEVRGAYVKLGFEADDEIPIHRAEVWERIRVECHPAEQQHDLNVQHNGRQLSIESQPPSCESSEGSLRPLQRRSPTAQRP